VFKNLINNVRNCNINIILQLILNISFKRTNVG